MMPVISKEIALDNNTSNGHHQTVSQSHSKIPRCLFASDNIVTNELY